MLKADDDSFACVGSVMHVLRSAPANLYAGALVNNPWSSNDRSSKWYNPQHEVLFGRLRYAPYFQGGGYILSANAVALVLGVARQMLNVSRMHALPSASHALVPTVEDALVGQLLCVSRTRPTYLDLTRQMRAWSAVNGSALPAEKVCEACGSSGMLLVHPLKSRGALEECAACASRRQRGGCLRLTEPPHAPRAVPVELSAQDNTCATRRCVT